MRRDAVDLAVANEDHAAPGVAEALRGRRTSVSKTACEIERRAADDLQHVGGRGLLLQRLGEIVASCALHLVEQPHVLDRDQGLIARRF